MIEPGFQSFPIPAPYHGPLAVEVQHEMYVIPADPDELVRWEATGTVRLILTGRAERMQPYLDACRALWEAEPA